MHKYAIIGEWRLHRKPQEESKQVKAGKTEAGIQRYKCQYCKTRFAPQPKERGYSDEVRIERFGICGWDQLSDTPAPEELATIELNLCSIHLWFISPVSFAFQMEKQIPYPLRA